MLRDRCFRLPLQVLYFLQVWLRTAEMFCITCIVESIQISDVSDTVFQLNGQTGFKGTKEMFTKLNGEKKIKCICFFLF